MRLAVRPSAHSLPQRARAGIRGYRLSRAGALYGRYPYRLLYITSDGEGHKVRSIAPHRGRTSALFRALRDASEHLPLRRASDGEGGCVATG